MIAISENQTPACGSNQQHKAAVPLFQGEQRDFCHGCQIGRNFGVSQQLRGEKVADMKCYVKFYL